MDVSDFFVAFFCPGEGEPKEGRRGGFRHGSNTMITPFNTHRADFKIEERSRKDQGHCVFFSEPFLGNFRDAGVFRNLLGGWTVRMDCVSGFALQ